MYKLKIKMYRILSNKTQKELSIKIGISQNYMSEIENGKYDVNLSLLFKVGYALEKCPKDLIECDCCYECKCKKKTRDYSRGSLKIE